MPVAREKCEQRSKYPYKIHTPTHIGAVRESILVSNAIKFSDAGEVMLSVKTQARSEREILLHFTVSDTGIGIPENKQAEICEAFKQADGSLTRKYGGTGLGLTISSRLVERMNGKIWIESKVGVGSHFHFTAQFRLRAAPTRKAVAANQEILRGLPVLVVDDNTTNRKILQKLVSAWGMIPTLTDGARHALAALEEASGKDKRFSLILMDAQMPEIDGFTLAKQILKNPKWSSASIMMLTSDGQRDDAAKCRELGLSAYLIKPIRQSELLQAILAVLGSLAPEEKESGRKAPCLESESRCQLNILLVEDNAVNQLFAARLLEKRGHAVTVAGNGSEALAFLKKQSFDLILMDVQMPGMDDYISKPVQAKKLFAILEKFASIGREPATLQCN